MTQHDLLQMKAKNKFWMNSATNKSETDHKDNFT